MGLVLEGLQLLINHAKSKDIRNDLFDKQLISQYYLFSPLAES